MAVKPTEVTSKVDAQTGNKFCRSCNSFRSLFNGSYGRDRLNRKTFICANCNERLKNRLRPSAGNEVNPKSNVTTVTPALVSDLMATESGVSHSQDTKGHGNNTQLSGGRADD